MDTDEIVALMGWTHKTLTSKGWYAYGSEGFAIDVSGVIRVSVTIRPPYDSEYNNGWKYEDNVTIKEIVGESDHLPDAISRFKTRVMTQVTLNDFMRVRFKQRLVDMVEEGERLGFALEYVAMLRATADKIASNALESPVDLT